MNITEAFIRRPVMTTLVMSGLVLFGVPGYTALPVSDLPNVDFPTLQVDATLPGASPEVMAASVATPLERQFSTIAGLDSMTSSSAPGMPTPPTLRKVNPADQPIMYLSLNSPTLPLSVVDEYAEIMIAQRISMI